MRTDARNCFYPIIIENEKIVGFGDVLSDEEHPKSQTEIKNNQFYVYPIDRNQIERKWRYARQSIENIADILRIKKRNYGYEIEIGKDYGTVRTVWQDSKYDANEYGAKLVNNLIGSSNFNYPKSVFNTYDCIAPILYERKNAIIVDYFAGSGTTAHSLMIMNKEDGGKRKCILCTNNENGVAEDICFPRIKSVINGHTDYKEITGINNNLRYFRTDFVPGESTDANKRLITERATAMLCLREDTYDEVENTTTWQIYRNRERHTGILFEPEQAGAFRARIETLEGPVNIYIFSLSDETYAEAFAGLEGRVTLCAVPESILKVYRRIYR